MKRILSLVLALVMVFGTIMPAFAETSTTKTSGEMLEEYGLIAGTGNGLEEDRPLKRSEMAVILAKLNNKANIAEAYAFPSSFKDVPATAWYSKWVAYAEVQNWMVGDATGGTFRPETYLSAQEVNILMVKALGYTDTKWEDANAKAEELKIAVNSKNANLVLRGDIFKAMTDTLDVPKKGEKDVLGTTLALKGYAAPTADTPEKLEVSKVIVNNRKTVVIEFNQELLKKSVNTTNFKVTGLTVSKVLLSEDKKTVTLDMSSSIAQSKEIELDIKKVKDVTDKKTLADYKEKYVVTDVTIPVIESITVIDAKHVKIQATEPMNFVYSAYTVLPGVKIDGNAVIGKVVADNENHTYTIEFNSAKKEGSYKMILEGLKDYSDLSAVKKEFSFDVVKDDAAPVAIGASAQSVTVVELEFDEPLTTTGSVIINGKSTSETFKADSNQKIILATLATADRLTLGATVEVNVKYKNQKDVVGNEVKTESSFTFRVEDDTTLPTSSIEVQAGNKVLITFSKAMDTITGSVIVKDKNAKVLKTNDLNGLGKWNTEKTELTITAVELDTSSVKLSETNPAEIIIELKGMKDSTVRSNLLVTTENLVTLLDTMKPVVQGHYITATGSESDKSDETVTFYFSEMMDEDTLKNLSNYLNGSTSFATVSGTSINHIPTDKRSVKINYPNAVSLLSSNLTVLAVKDMAGNMAAPKFNIAKGSTSTKLTFGTGDIAIAKSTTQITVKFNQPIKTIDPAAISILNTDNSAKTTVSSIEKIEDDTVTINLVEALDTDVAKYKVNIAGKSLVISNYDTTFDSAIITASIKDLVAPTVTELDDGVWITDKIVAKDNNAILTFSEAIDDTKEFTNVIGLHSGLTVKLTEGSEVKYLASTDYTLAVDNSKKALEITVKAGVSGLTSGTKTLEVKLNSPNVNLVDAFGNQMLPFTKTITDFVYDVTIPTATVEYQDSTNNGQIDKIVITSSGGNITEAVAGDFTLNAAAGGDDLVKGALTVSGNVATLAVTGVVDVTSTNDTLAWAAGSFKVNGHDVVERVAAVMTDKAVPQVKSLAVASTHGTPTIAKIGDSVVYTMTFTENVTTAVVTASDINNIAGAVTTDLNAVNAASDTIEFTVATSDIGAVSLNALNFTITDSNSNVKTYATHGAVTTDSGAVTGAVTVDGVAPTVVVTADSTAVKDGDTVIFTATFSQDVKAGVTPKMTLSGGETLAATDMVETSRTVWTLTRIMASGANATVQAQTTLAVDATDNPAIGNFAATANDTLVVADNIDPAATLDIDGAALAVNAIDSITADKTANTIVIAATGEFEVGLVVDVTKITIDANDDDGGTATATLAALDVASIVSDANSITITLNADGAANVNAVLAAFTGTGLDSVDFAAGWLADAAGNVIPAAGIGTTPKTQIIVTP